MKNIFIAGLLSIACASANANNFVLTTGDSLKNSGKQSFALDFVSSGNGTTLVVKVAIPDTELAKVDLSGCGKGLPTGFNGQCAVAKGNLIMLVTHGSDALLPSGAISLGVFSVEYSDGKARKLSISSTEVASPQSEEMPSTSVQ